VIDREEDGARRWESLYRPKHELLMDPRLDLVRAYRVRNSAYVVLIGSEGRVVRQWPGYSSSMLAELGSRLAEMTGVREEVLDLDGAPGAEYTGCPYEVDVGP
jgi:hypothetical protein